LVGEAVRQFEERPPLRADEFTRYQQEPLANRREREALPGLRETETPEPVEEVVREDHELEVGLVRLPVAGWDLPESVRLLHLPDDEFGYGPPIVEAPHVQRRQLQVGDEDAVDVFAQVEETQLPRRYWGRCSPGKLALGCVLPCPANPASMLPRSCTT